MIKRSWSDRLSVLNTGLPGSFSVKSKSSVSPFSNNCHSSYLKTLFWGVTKGFEFETEYLQYSA